MAELVDFWVSSGILIMILMLGFFAAIIGYCVVKSIWVVARNLADKDAYNRDMQAYLEKRKHRRLSYCSDTVGEGPRNSSQS